MPPTGVPEAPATAGATDTLPAVSACLPDVWGDTGVRVYAFGEHVASNGAEFRQLFSLDLDFNLWLARPWGVYLFADTRFWGQRAAPGITNSSQGAFDFSKREFDFNIGAAWSYYDQFEARVFGYSFNNLNRGASDVVPTGFNDGLGIENRYYLGSEYGKLGTADFDVARASFMSIGYYPSKSMVDALGNEFHPGAFARVYLTQPLFTPRLYLYTDDQFIMDIAGSPTLFTTDSGIAVRPFERVPRLEIRIGSEDTIELRGSDVEASVYVSLNYIF